MAKPATKTATPKANPGTLAVTDVRINVMQKGTLCGFADITLNGAFVVKGLKIVNGSKGLFVSMPSEKNKAGEYFDRAYPLHKETRAMIQDAVLLAYDKA
jgi:stage V sporulation protein G